mgnify:CR=1 FL=1
MSDVTLITLDTAARDFSKAHADLASVVAALQAELESTKKNFLPPIKRCVGKAAEFQQTLRDLIARAAHLFLEPRTLVLHGIRCGFRKQPGKLDFDKEALVCERIKKHFPERAAELIRLKEEPDKDALAKLTAAELKRLGVTLSADCDQIVLKPVADDVDKFVTALLKDAADVA